MTIDTILRDNDLLRLAEHDGAQFKKGRTDWRSHCPIHKGEDRGAFAVWEEDGKQKWKCFTGVCGSGDVLDYVMAYERVDLKRAMEILGGDHPVTQAEAQQAAEARRVSAEAYEARKRAEYHQALEELWRARMWERYYTNLENDPDAQQLWIKRGIPVDWQSLWQLGYCPDFVYSTDGAVHHSASLTIPIFTGRDQPDNIRHRILSPFNPNDKYRPDRPGLKALPFMADQYEKDHECVLVVEGEIKAMVSYIWLDSKKWQVYGIPGKEQYRELCESLKGRAVWFAFDPDATSQAEAAARVVGGRVIPMVTKIDDALNARILNTKSLRRLLSMARKV
jgi:hypothetical protein